MTAHKNLVIMLCRNAIGLSIKALQTLYCQTVSVDILTVNNASSDGTTSYLISQQARHGIYTMTYPRVQSVARCWNHALSWAWETGHERALVINADVELLPETFAVLAHHLQGNGLISAVGVDEPAEYPEEPFSYRPHPDYSCFMIAKWAHTQVPFDEHYQGAYFEDCDHHVRLFRAGIYAGCVNLEYRHHASGTLKCGNQAERNRINWNFARNKARFLGQYGCLPGTEAYNRLFLPHKQPQAQHLTPAS